MTMWATTPAVGGAREVPIPDPIARDYLLLALRLDQQTPGLVDGYFGPADLKAQVDMEQLRAPAQLVEDAAELLQRVSAEVAEADRREWLADQVVALRTHAERLAGTDLPYLETVTRLFAWTPVARDESVFDEAAAEIDGLLPGDASVAERLAAWDRDFEIPVDRLPAVVDWLVGQFRERARVAFGLPHGEAIRFQLVHAEPWTGYNWYEGGFRSRFDLNTDLPITASDLVHVAAHEAYPGHHTEHALRESELVEGLGRLESSVLLINAPECLISEGLADVGHRFASPAEIEPDLLVELYDRAGLPIATDAGAARSAAETTVALRRPRRRLAESRVNAALLRHAEGRSHEDVLAFLERVGRFAPAVAAKRLEFIEHPLWRTYVHVYHEGEALLERWLEAVPEPQRPDRFGRLLREQLGPTAISAEIAAAGPRSDRGAAGEIAGDGRRG